MRSTRYPLNAHEAPIERLLQEDKQVVLRFTAHGIPLTIGTMDRQLRQNINVLHLSYMVALTRWVFGGSSQ